MTEDPDDVKTAADDTGEAEPDGALIEAETRRRVRLRNAVLGIIGYDGPDDDPGWFNGDIGAELRDQFPDATTAELGEALSDASDYIDHDGIDDLQGRIAQFEELRDMLTNASDWVDGNDDEDEVLEE